MKKKARKGARRERRGGTWARILEEEGVRRALWILNVPTSLGELKGLIAEEKSLRGLEGLQRRKVEFCQVGAIMKVTPTEHLSQEDQEGIDIKVEFQNGKIVFADVKGHRWTQSEARVLLKRSRCLIAIPERTSDEEAKEMVWEQTNWFLQEREKERRGDQLLGAHR